MDWVFQMWFPWRFSSPELVVGLAALFLFFDFDMVFLHPAHKKRQTHQHHCTPTFKKKQPAMSVSRDVRFTVYFEQSIPLEFT
mmetsp:Transcript_3677/g.7517  ORF Transcript_3677/g.7517 Transcript_3677/m.7517 type:complete len:83 (-) Transcript_3677:354-602(-)